MTTSNPSPLDRVEMALAAIAESQAASNVRLDRIEQLTESNARAIAAHGEELRTSLAAHREELRASIADVVNMVGGVAVQRQQEQAAGDRENSTQIEVLLGESRENIRQHQVFIEEGVVFRDRLDRMFAEIRTIWQRLVG
jgi:catalase (peroxidase I)